jgi:hypothetical protein
MFVGVASTNRNQIRVLGMGFAQPYQRQIRRDRTFQFFRLDAMANDLRFAPGEIKITPPLAGLTNRQLDA